MLNKLLVTGAAGGLGTLMRERLSAVAKTFRLSDIAEMEPDGKDAEFVRCDLADRDAVMSLVEGCDGILHLGGISIEKSFDAILPANIVGVYNLYEAARAHGMPRILFASSNHTIGYYTQDTNLTADVPLRPDGLYGVSKCFGEAVASLYYNKFGQETAIVRIGSCFEKPRDHRMLSTWMSPDDFARLIECVFRAPRLGCPVIWGVSDNDTRWWDNTAAAFLGWRPKDSSEPFRREIDEAMARPAADAPDAVYQGGKFTAEPIHEP